MSVSVFISLDGKTDPSWITPHTFTDLPTGPHFVVTRAEFVDEVRQHVRGSCELVARNEDVTRARPYRPLILLRIGTHPWPTNPPRD